ncbi:hypothetical protein [Streptomyces sp. NPDC005438]|uniref:hypothetical protein n=1 Tax=Streptomyces sp. NPDC005438 TaxID=3156880 RepID=UPI0033A7073B
MRRTRVLVAVVLSLVLVGAWVLCVEWPVDEPPTATGESSRAGNRPVRLEDGRRVLVRFTDQGLVERHQSAEGRPWSRPKVLYARSGDPECPVRLSTYRNTVTVVAHYYGSGCYAESEAETVVVAVSDGDLGDWDRHLSAGWLDWKEPRYSWSGLRVVFRQGEDALSWRQTIGFTGATDGPPD